MIDGEASTAGADSPPSPHRRPGRARVPGWIAGIATWAIGAIWFFRDPLTSGFDTITGDRGDARLVIFLHEHWWRVWHGDASWRSPDMFAPVDGTLGYSDTFFLNQLVYAPLRLAGFDQFVSFQLTLIALTAIGFASLFRLFRHHIGLALGPSCLLAAVGAFANNVFIDTGHPQIYSVNLISLILLVFVSAWHGRSTRRRAVGAAIGGLLIGLLLWTAFYFGWFIVFFGGLTVVGVAAIGWIVAGRQAVLDVLFERWSMLAAMFGGLVVGLVPFAATYLPVLDDSEPRSYDEVAGLAPRPLDLLNVGRDNVAWGWLVRPLLDGDERLDQLNRAVAPTPILMFLTALATASLVRRLRRGDINAVTITGVAAGVVTGVALLLPIQFGFGGLWAWTHRLVPGGSALRVYARTEVVASLLACLTVALWVRSRQGDTGIEPRDHMGSGRRATVIDQLVIAALAFVAFEQLNTSDRFRQFDRSDELALLAAVTDAPDGCDVFYVTDAERAATDHSLISAMLISHDIDTPTINGYSGQVPPSWDLRPWNDDYTSQVDAWLRLNQEGFPGEAVCRLELTTLDWSSGADVDSAADGVDQ